LRTYESKTLGVDVVVLEFDRPADTVERASELSGYEPSEIVKTLLVRVGSEYSVVLVRGDKRLDLGSLSEMLGASAALAKASEVKRILKAEVGGVTPLSEEVRKLRALMDDSILEKQAVVCGGGDRRRLYVVKVTDLVKVLKPTVARITK